MSKRGSVGLAVLIAVLLVAVLGLYFVLSVPNEKDGDVQLVVTGPTGEFVLPAAKEYGGAVRGIAAPGTRAFPSGRALETGDQSCFSCSCLGEGITAADRSAAERVCADNCGGVVSSVIAGPCR